MADVAIRQYDAIELVGQPCDAEGRCNDHAHPGDFASCLLLCRRSSPNASLCASLNSKRNCYSVSTEETRLQKRSNSTAGGVTENMRHELAEQSEMRAEKCQTRKCETKSTKVKNTGKLV